MNKYILMLVIIIFTGCAGLQSPQETKVAVSTLLKEIKIAVNIIAEQTKEMSLPPFQYAELVLLTKTTQTKEGNLSIFLTAEGKKSANNSNKLTLTLVPSKRSKRNKDSATSDGEQLAKYVIAAVEAVHNKKYLELQKLIVEAGIKVGDTVNGGVKIEVSGFSIGAKGSNISSDSHTLKLVFEPDEE